MIAPAWERSRQWYLLGLFPAATTRGKGPGERGPRSRTQGDGLARQKLAKPCPGLGRSCPGGAKNIQVTTHPPVIAVPSAAAERTA